MILNSDARRMPLPRGCVQLIVTSPPYLNAREYSHWDNYADYLADMASCLSECWRVLCDGGRIAINVPHGYDRPGNGGYKPISDHIGAILVDLGFELRGHIIWSKSGISPQAGSTAWGSWQSASDPALRDEHEVIIVAHKGNKRLEPVGESTIDRETFLEATKSVWEIAPISHHKWHPATFPEEIPRRLIELYSYKDSLVLDPFAGSGTTVRVAERLGRRAIGLEYSWEYAYLANIENTLYNWQGDHSHTEWLLLKRKLQRQKELIMGGTRDLSELPIFKETSNA